MAVCRHPLVSMVGTAADRCGFVYCPRLGLRSLPSTLSWPSRSPCAFFASLASSSESMAPPLLLLLARPRPFCFALISSFHQLGSGADGDDSGVFIEDVDQGRLVQALVVREAASGNRGTRHHRPRKVDEGAGYRGCPVRANGGHPVPTKVGESAVERRSYAGEAREEAEAREV